MASGVASLSLDQLSIDTLRLLAVDEVEKAKSGHPGAPLGCAPIAYLLFHKLMKHNPAHSKWADRDRFVLSNGHASALLYGTLFLSRLQADAGRFEELSPVGIEDAGASGVRLDRRRGGDHRPAGAGIRDGGGNGHRGEASGGGLQPPRLQCGGPPHLCAVRRRRPDGGPVARGCLAGRNAGAGQADRSLRRQPDLARRADQVELHGECRRALRGLQLARAARGGRQRPGRH